MSLTDLTLYRLVFAGLMAFAFGIQTSVSLPALLHIFGAVPAFVFTRRYFNRWREIPLSAYALIALILLTLLSGFFNYSELVEKGKSLTSVKYGIFSICFSFAIHAYMQEDRSKQLKWFTSILCITIILAAVLGLIRSELGFNLKTWQYQYYSPRTGGFYGYMRYAYNLQYLITGLAALLMFPSSFKSYYNKKLVVTALLFAVAGLLFSETRGALLATVAGLIILAFLKNKKWGIRLGLAALMCLSLAVSYVVLKPAENSPANDASQGSDTFRMLESYKSRSNSLRVSQFQAALKAFEEKPLLGFGPGQFRFQVQRLKIQYGIDHQDYYNQHAHNIFLETLANIGLFGFLVFMAWLILWGVELTHALGPFSRFIALPCFVVTLISGQVEYLFSATGAFTIFLLYSASLAESYQAKFRS